MTSRYDLTREPWIPCVRADGRQDVLGLGAALAEAHELRGLSGMAPTESVAMVRFLATVLRRVLGDVPTDRAWRAAWKAGRTPEAALTKYLTRWRGRFQLFGEHPFAQSAAAVGLLPRGPAGAPVRRLVWATCNYGAPSLLFALQKPKAELATLPAAAAARALLAFQTFAMGGKTMGPSAKSAPLAQASLVVAVGRTLYETLLMAMVPEEAAADAPAWERDLPTGAEVRALTGPLDAYSLLSRSCALREAEGGAGAGAGVHVDAFGYLPGFVAENAADLRDPMVAYRQLKDGKWIPVGVDPAMTVWPLAHAILGFGEASRRPATLDHLARMADLVGDARDGHGGRGGRDGPIEVLAQGLRWDQKAIVTSVNERLVVPPRLLADVERLGALRDVIGFAAAVEKEMFAGAKAYAGTLGVGAKGVADRPRRLYWGALAGDFERFLLELVHGTDPTRAVAACKLGIERRGKLAFARAIGGGGAQEIRAAAVGQAVLRGRIAGVKCEGRAEGELKS